MEYQPFSGSEARKIAARQAALRAQFEACRAELGQLDWLSEGSVTEGRPNDWRWTRKVQGKTVTLTLSPAQVEAFREAIANHRKLEKIIREMRALSQAYLLETIPGPTRRPRGPRPKSLK